MAGIKKILSFVIIVAFVVAACIMAFSGEKIEHIEDTNGADNYTLQTITDREIQSLSVGAKGFSQTSNNVTGNIVYSSKKYTGVTEFEGTGVLTGDYTVTIKYFDVEAGNVKLVLVRDDRIVHEFMPNEDLQSYTIEDAAGSYVSLRIAGESAKFKLDIL